MTGYKCVHVSALSTCSPGRPAVASAQVDRVHGSVVVKVEVSPSRCTQGYSEQVDTKALELEDIRARLMVESESQDKLETRHGMVGAPTQALKRMSATCEEGHGLRSITAEASDKGAWIRLRYATGQRRANP